MDEVEPILSRVRPGIKGITTADWLKGEEP